MISVVITTHDRKNLLVRAIKSVQTQTYKDLEIIVVSDGSTDGTDEIVSQMEMADNRLSFIELSPARGANAARNAGIKASRGDWVAFLDDDDEWLPEKLEKQVSLIQTDKEIGLCYTWSRALYVEYGIDYISAPRACGRLDKEILFSNHIGTTSTVLINKSLFKMAGMFDEALCALQDYDLWIRMCQVTTVGVVTEPLIYYYNYGNSGQISGKTDKYVRAIECIDHKYSNLFEKLSGKERKEKEALDLGLLSKKCLRNGDKKSARMYARKAMIAKFCLANVEIYMLSWLGFKTALKLRRLKSGGVHSYLIINFVQYSAFSHGVLCYE